MLPFFSLTCDDWSCCYWQFDWRSNESSSTDSWKSSQITFFHLPFSSFFIHPNYLSPNQSLVSPVSLNNLFITFVLSLVLVFLCTTLSLSFIVCFQCIFLFSLLLHPHFLSLLTFSVQWLQTQTAQTIILVAILICFLLETKHEWGQLINKPLFTFPCTKTSPVILIIWTGQEIFVES